MNRNLADCKNKKTFYIGCIFMLISLNSKAQNSDYPKNTIGLETQIYPTGIIPGISFEFGITTKSFVYSRIGFNFFNHRGLGIQDEEQGSGYGFSIGYKTFLNNESRKWRVAIKNDIWKNTVNWKNTSLNGEEESGQTKLLVLQPTIETSYVIATKTLMISPSVAFGREWNVKTNGLPTGEGFILLIGIQISRSLNR